MRGCYLYWKRDFVEPLTGVDRKVLDSIGCLKDFGECDLGYVARPESLLGKVLSSIPLFPDGYRWPTAAELAKYDYIWIRKPRFISRELLQAIKKAKQLNSCLKVILDIPSYPYDKEMHSLFRYFALQKDRTYRMKLQGLVDRIVSPAEVKSIFGVPAIRVMNGISLASIRCRASSFQMPDSIQMICVATFARWHGVDRIIAGMEKYYMDGGARGLVLHLVGDGPVLPKLKVQVEQAGLSGHVKFYGCLGREGMDEVFDRCSLAIECLGIHRKNPEGVSSSLKSREYLAKGIPFIYSAPIDVLEQHPVDFCLRVPGDESPIDMEKVVDFHDRLYAEESEEHVIKRIRAYAEDYVGWDATMRPVIDYINS